MKISNSLLFFSQVIIIFVLELKKKKIFLTYWTNALQLGSNNDFSVRI